MHFFYHSCSVSGREHNLYAMSSGVNSLDSDMQDLIILGIVVAIQLNEMTSSQGARQTDENFFLTRILYETRACTASIFGWHLQSDGDEPTGVNLPPFQRQGLEPDISSVLPGCRSLRTQVSAPMGSCTLARLSAGYGACDCQNKEHVDHSSCRSLLCQISKLHPIVR